MSTLTSTAAAAPARVRTGRASNGAVPLSPFHLPEVAPAQAGIPGELLLALAELGPARLPLL